MKNKKPLLIGILITLILIFFVSGIIQYLIINLLGVTVKDVVFSSSGITPIFEINIKSNPYFNSVLIFSRLLISILFLELGLLLLSKFPMGIYRFATITSLLSLVGYLIISFFYGIISALVSSNYNSNFAKLIKLLELEGNQNFVLMLFLLILFVAYLHLVQKRVIQYISISE
ncbi:MAG: hypothetical protein L3J41_04865 [Melioribacteraceae bacterium]|nr:hypothetical protein [Melioribacteraceae bacterium]